MNPSVIVQFDKITGLSVVGKNLQHKFTSLKEAFAFVSECNRNPYIRNIEIKRIDNSE